MDKLEKLLKKLGEDTAKEMEALDSTGLKKTIVEANQAMKEVADELEKNERYQSIKESKKAAEEGKREVNKRQKARIEYALQLLSEKGE